MWYCENCGMPMQNQVYGTGNDATGYCRTCEEHVNCFDEEEVKNSVCVDEEATKNWRRDD